ncbi:uncharacterized protein ACIBXB_017342 [Morphnus guianensis]
MRIGAYLKTISIFLNSCTAGFPKRSFSFFQGIICFPRNRIRKNLRIFISPQVPIQFNRARPRRSDRTDHLLFPTPLSHLAKRPEDWQGAATSSAQVLLQKCQSPARREPPQASLLPTPAGEAGAPSTSSIFTTRARPGTAVSPSAVRGEGATAAAACQERRAARERSHAWRARRQNTSALTGWRRRPQRRHSRPNGRQPPLTATNHRLQQGRALPEAARAVPARAGRRAGRQYVCSAPIGSRPGRAAGACAVGVAVRRCDAGEHGGGRAAGAAAAAAAAGRGGGWRPGAVAVGAVLLAGPVALRPLRPGALRGHLPAALRAPGPEPLSNHRMHLMKTSSGRGGPFVQHKQLGTRLHLHLNARGIYIHTIS